MTQPVTAISVAPEANLAWVHAFQETQRQTAEAHAAYQRAMADPEFVAEFAAICRDYAGTPSLLYDARRLSDRVGARILLKREDLNHTGANKIRNVLGQASMTAPV